MFWHGVELYEFDYWYYDESTSSTGGGRSRIYHRFNCVVTGVDASCWPLRIERENVLSRLADELGFNDIEFESEEFNRTFTVKAADTKFAYDFIDVRMMRFLVESGGRYSFEARGGRLLTWVPQLRPTEIVPVLGTARAFREHVPGVVRALYGTPATG